MAVIQVKESRMNRLILPALAFKAVVIGGGYATGRELVEFFLPNGAIGGLAAMLLAAAVWSAVCVLTFTFALASRSSDYQSFFRALLGRFAIAFELLLILYTIVTLSVFGAAAGAIGTALCDAPSIVGTLVLSILILVFTMRGNAWVESLFKYVSILLYGTYAVFLVLCLRHFGDRIAETFAHSNLTSGWIGNGVTYASYNVIGAVLILPALRHQTRPRDAVLSGLLAGPLAMLPAIVFFVCLSAYGHDVAAQSLPADYLLRRLDLPPFHWLFEAMVFAALLECSVGNVHAINERVIRHRSGGSDSPMIRLLLTVGLLAFAMGVAQAVGLVALIASGYRLLAYLVLAVFIVPLLTVGSWRLLRRGKPAAEHAGAWNAEAASSAEI